MYNNCFILTGISRLKNGKLIKKGMYIKDGKVKTLYKWDTHYNKVIEENLQYYQLDYSMAQAILYNYWTNGKRTKGDESLRIGIWLEDAKWNDLYLLCIDFDKVNGEIIHTPFFNQCLKLCNFYTRSQSGGYHCWFGIDYETARPLFEKINLTTHRHTKSFVCSINLTSNGEDKFDIFCRNGRIIYEYEDWNIKRGVTDKTIELHQLLKQYLTLEKKKDIDFWEDASGIHISLEGLPEELLLEQMNERQKKIFFTLYNRDASSQRNYWFRIGCNIKEVFGEELGGSVWLWWSKQGDNYQPQACVNTWGEICRRKTELEDLDWMEILEVNGIEQFKKEKEEIRLENMKTSTDITNYIRQSMPKREETPIDIQERFASLLFI